MNLRFTLALLAGKLLRVVGKPFGKATNLPGSVALKLCPDLFSRFRFRGRVLAVTGSNGKTTTANAVAHILTGAGYTVANNAKGSNLTGGVATTLLGVSSLRGVVPQDFVVLEVDERYSRLIFRGFSPELLLVTNLFRDQLTRNGNVDVIVAKLTEAIAPSVKLVLNANDPISAGLAPGSDRVYYAMERTAQSTDESVNITHDAKACPRCFGHLGYDYYHYNHIGRFRCPNCGWESPAAAYTASEPDFRTGAFSINGIRLESGCRTPYMFLNLTAAVALCCEAGVPVDEAVRLAAGFRVSRQRFDEFDIGGRRAVLILSKNQNPVSFDQSISYVLGQEGRKNVVVFVNNINHTNNKDTTWLYDISFERLAGHCDALLCTGPRAMDLAVRLELGGYPMDAVTAEPDPDRLGAALAATDGTIYILTELYDANIIVRAVEKRMRGADT